MMQCTEFYYDGIHSSDMGIIHVTTQSGLYDETFMATKIINEDRIRGQDVSYLNSVEYEPLSFTLELYFENGMSDDECFRVARWLNQKYYKPFYTLDNPERIFY
ncbi:phage tail domain-containing protein, partial [Bacillus sp. JJ1532]|uniref:phage tail domain-containing protein n=1 Tax=Bacillus sp. JJ1532 TaxID=3122958 RepID=UPI003000B556